MFNITNIFVKNYIYYSSGVLAANNPESLQRLTSIVNSRLHIAC